MSNSLDSSCVLSGGGCLFGGVRRAKNRRGSQQDRLIGGQQRSNRRPIMPSKRIATPKRALPIRVHPSSPHPEQLIDSPAGAASFATPTPPQPQRRPTRRRRRMTAPPAAGSFFLPLCVFGFDWRGVRVVRRSKDVGGGSTRRGRIDRSKERIDRSSIAFVCQASSIITKWIGPLSHVSLALAPPASSPTRASRWKQRILEHENRLLDFRAALSLPSFWTFGLSIVDVERFNRTHKGIDRASNHSNPNH